MKTISFINRTWDQILSAYQALKERYKEVQFPFFHSKSGMYNGYFTVVPYK